MDRSMKLATGLATAAAAVSGSGMLSNNAAQAVVVTSNTPITIPNNGIGLYINVVTGVSSTTPFAGYDINPYGTAAPSFFSGTTASAAGTRGYVAPTATGAASNLANGFVVDGTSLYNEGVSSGTNFADGTTGVFGFRFVNEGTGAVNYGYANFTNPAGTGPYTINSISYENSGGSITVVVPEPTSLGLLAAGSLGLLRRRNKAA